MSDDKEAKKFIDRIGQKAARPTNEQEEKFVECLNVIMGTAEGKYVFKRILRMTGFHQTSVTLIDGKVDTDAISYNEGRRSIWLDLRRRMNRKSKEIIET